MVPILEKIPQVRARILTMADQMFAAAFQRAFAFSLLYEDSEVDNRVLELHEDSRVLAVTGAGCGVAGLLAARPRSVDAVDTNRHHLALTALKVAAAKNMTSYEEFYQLLGHGWHRDTERCLRNLVSDLPDWMIAYWAKNHTLFQKNLYAEGLAGAFQKWLRRRTRVDDDYLQVVQKLDPAAREAELANNIIPKVRSSSLFRIASHTPLFLLGHGINFQQMQRNLSANQTRSMVDVVTARIQRIAQTDLETNWIAWIALIGRFNHANSEAVPPYLRADNHARSLHGPTKVSFHNESLQSVLERPPRGGWSHFSLCDVLDWMPDEIQRQLLVKIAHRATPGAIVLTRSVEDGCIAERLGLEGLYTLIEPMSTEASEQERTGLYGRVNVYRVAGSASGGRSN